MARLEPCPVKAPNGIAQCLKRMAFAIESLFPEYVLKDDDKYDPSPIALTRRLDDANRTGERRHAAKVW